MKTVFLSTIAAVALTAGGALAHSVWDTNQDGMIDADEYMAGMAEDDTFAAYDANQDGMIDQDEFNQATWRTYDMDGDGMWSQTEAGVWEDSKIRAGGDVSQ